MAKRLRKGDRVSWETSQGRTSGTVVRKQAEPMRIKGHEVAASPDDPQYVVRSAKSGAIAAYEPEALKKS